MSWYLTRIAEKRTLWLLLVMTLLMTAAFAAVPSIFGITLIDGLSEPNAVWKTIEDMSESQRHTHQWLTATLDVAFPLVYGSLFAGAALRFFGSAGKWLAVPALLVIPVDLVEGAVQICLLGLDREGLEAKAVLTQTKVVLFVTAAVLAIAGVLKSVLTPGKTSAAP